MTALLAQDLRKSIALPTGARLDLLRGVDLRVERGESVAVVGRSGSGKSTLLALLGLLSQADGGTLRIAGHDVSSLGDRGRSRLRAQRIGFVFQNYSLLGHLDAAENVALPLTQGSTLRRAEIRARAESALDSVGVGHLADRRPKQLSGGEQQRVAIARALVGSPELILADEPTGALDTATAEQVLTGLLDVARLGVALVLVTHDPVVAARAGRVCRLDAGRIGEQ